MLPKVYQDATGKKTRLYSQLEIKIADLWKFITKNCQD